MRRAKNPTRGAEQRLWALNKAETLHWLSTASPHLWQAGFCHIIKIFFWGHIAQPYFWYLTWCFGSKGEGICVDISHYFIIPVEPCAIHLCQPLYQPGPVCVYIKLIDEQFIRLMGSAGADKRPATSSGFKKQPEFAGVWCRLRQRFRWCRSPRDRFSAVRTIFETWKYIILAVSHKHSWGLCA